MSSRPCPSSWTATRRCPVHRDSAQASAASRTSLTRVRYTVGRAAQQRLGVLGAEQDGHRAGPLDRRAGRRRRGRGVDRSGGRRAGRGAQWSSSPSRPPAATCSASRSDQSRNEVVLAPRSTGSPRTRLPVGRVQVVEQDAPGDAVDHQVVARPATGPGAAAPRSNSTARSSGPGARAKRGVHVVGELLHGRRLLVGRRRRTARAGAGRRPARPGACAGASRRRTVLEAQPQRVVVGEQRVERGAQCPRVQLGGQLDQDGLVEVVRVGRCGARRTSAGSG